MIWINSINLLSLTIITILTCSVDGLVEVMRSGELFPARTAEFGPRIKMDGITGILLPIELLDENGLKNGCQVLKDPPVLKINNDQVPWIALIERGSCTFLQKIKAMQDSGAAAVVVGGTSNTNPRTGGLIRMDAGKGEEHKKKDIKISSVYIMKWEYEGLQKYLRNEPEVNAKVKSVAIMKDGRRVPHLVVKLTPDGFDDWPLINVALVIFLIPLLLVLCIWALWQFKLGNSYDQDDYESIYLIPQRYRSDPQDMPASLSAVNNMAKTTYDPQKRGPNDADLCAICLEDFLMGDELRKLPCKHEFHVGCIDPWLLTRKRFCPVCKSDSCPDNFHSNAFASPEQVPISHVMEVTIPDNVSASSIILDPSPNQSMIDLDESESLLPGSNDNQNNRRSLLSSVLEKAWRSSSSMPSTSTRLSRASPFPVVDRDDYEMARRLALINRRNSSSRSSSSNSSRNSSN